MKKYTAAFPGLPWVTATPRDASNTVGVVFVWTKVYET